MYGCLLAFFIGIVFILFSFFTSIVRFIMGIKQTVQKAAKGETTQAQSASEETGTANHQHSHRRPSGRFIDKDEGEYVDYEEI